MEYYIALFASTLRVSTPLLFAAMGGLFSERSGVINIALEGFMLIGAFAAAAAALLTGEPWIGWFAGIGAGVLFAALYALSVIRFRSDQIVAGTAMNFLAMGLTPFFCNIVFGSTAATPSLALEQRFTLEPMFMAGGAIILLSFWIRRTPSGLWCSVAGEHPSALRVAGVSVRATRWLSVLMSGALAGAGGATLSICLSSSFVKEISAGRGFMALAALILGKWRPIPTLLACLFFGLSDALQIQLQGVSVFGFEKIPVQFIQILPYAVTILVLAGFVGKSRPPKALGESY